MGGGIAALDGVAPLVNEACHLQTILFGGGDHELPESCGSGTADGSGVEGRLYDGQELQLQGQLICFQSLLEDGCVEVRGAEHDAHRPAQASCVLVDELAHDIVVGHLDDVGQALQTVDILLLGELGAHACVLAVAVGLCEVLTLVPVEDETVHLAHHTLRQGDVAVVGLVAVGEVGVGLVVVVAVGLVVVSDLGIVIVVIKVDLCRHGCCHDEICSEEKE